MVERYAEEIIEIADDAKNDWMEREGFKTLNQEHIQRSRVRIDTRKWLMAKLMPKKYGDRVEVVRRPEEMTDDELAAALAAAEKIASGDGDQLGDGATGGANQTRH